MSELSKEKLKKYIESGYGDCPVCKTNDKLEGGNWESDGNQAWREYECGNCGTTFEDIYTLTDVEIKK